MLISKVIKFSLVLETKYDEWINKLYPKARFTQILRLTATSQSPSNNNQQLLATTAFFSCFFPVTNHLLISHSQMPNTHWLVTNHLPNRGSKLSNLEQILRIALILLFSPLWNNWQLVINCSGITGWLLNTSES